MKRPNYDVMYVLHVMPEEIQDVGRIIKDFEISTKENLKIRLLFLVFKKLRSSLN